MSSFDGHIKQQFITPKEVPDPEVKPDIPGPIIMVRPLEPENTINTKSGFKLHLPDSYHDDARYLTNVGIVYKVGDLAYSEPKPGENRFGNRVWCKEGDTIVWRKHAGSKIVYKGVIFTILNDDEVVMRLQDAGDIDVHKNTVRV